MSLVTAAVESDLATSLARAREAQLSALGEEPLSWLAAVPVWTDRLARSVGFPESTGELTEFVERADEAGLCRKRRSFGDDGEPVLHFWMQSSARADVVDWLGQRSRRQIRQLTFDLASRIQMQAGVNTETAPCVYQWMKLAAEARDNSEEAAGQFLNREVARLAGQHDTATALEMVAAAESLAAVLGGSLEAAVPRARRRIGLEYRRQQDETLLRNFLNRSEPLAAATALLDGPDDLWALHIAGVGGVGKTMFIRYLANRYAKERSHCYAVSRIDFDHLPPLYPARKPGQLLLELADELFCDITTPKQERQFDRLLERVTRAHEDIGSLRTGEVGQARIMSPLMGKALDAFASLCRSLDRPVLLILDTCEELAKVRIGGQGIRAVDATFVLLEQLNKRMPSLRVLFAGRRPLANCGAGEWSYDSNAAGPGALGDLPKRDYLMLQELRAFSREEVVTFLSDVHGMQVGEGALEKLLDSSPEPGRLVGLRTAATDEQPRYNPMDIEMFVFGGDPDAYITDRVIGRLEEYERHLLPALPAAALLGRFDASMLAPVLEGQGSSPSDVLSGLAQQEWIAISGGRDPSTWFLEVKPGVLDRLRQHFEAELPGVAADLAPRLAGLVDQRALADQPLDYAVEAIRLLPPGPAARLWDRIAVKATGEAQWEWVRALAEQVLAPDDSGRVPLSVQAIGAAILATSIAAIRRGDREWDPTAQWAAVGEAAAVHPDTPTRTWLEVRARLGRLTGAALAQHRLTQAEMDQFVVDLTTLVPEGNDRDHPLGPALVSALDAVLESAGTVDAVLPEHVRGFLDGWRPVLEGGLLAFALCLCARVVARHRSLAEAWPLFVEAEQLAGGPESSSRGWGDWIAPDSLVDRIRLEWLLCASTAEDLLSIRPALDAWSASSADRATTIDAERLASLLLSMSMDTGVPEADRLERLEAADAYTGGRRSACVAHDRVSPLFISVARAWVVRGEAERALALLDLREGQALSQRSARPDSDTARAAEACVIDVVRRMRIRSRMPQVERFARDRDLAPQSWAARSLVLSPAEASIERPGSAEWLHAWFRCLPTARDAAAAREALTGSDPHVWLDAYEADLAASLAGMPSKSVSDGAMLLAKLHSAYTDAPPVAAEPNADELTSPLRLQLRSWAFGLPDAAQPVIASHRRAAELALDEGELLALRLPAAGAKLLAYALERYEMAGDPVGIVTSGVALAVAYKRSGQTADAMATLDARVRTAYERLGLGLPEWQVLASKEAPGAIAAAPDGWAGWLARLQSCLAAPSRRPRITTEPQAVELGLNPPLERPESTPLDRQAKRWATFLFCLLLVYTTRRVGKDTWNKAFGSVDFGPVPYYAGIVAYYGFLVWVAGYLIHKGTLLFVNVSGASPSEPATIKARVALRPAPQNSVTRWFGLVSLLVLWPYYLMAKALAWRRPVSAVMRAGEVDEGSISRALRARLRRRWFLRTSVKTAIAVDPQLASLPWEASLTVPFGGRAASNPFRVGRGGPVPSATIWATRAVATPSTASWQLLLEEGWAPFCLSVMPWQPPFPSAANGLLLSESSRQQPPMAVLHVVGMPVLTTTGWRIRLDDKRPDQVGPTTPSQGGQTLLGPEALAYTGASLVVIEAPPTGTVVEIDRESADGLRQLATEVVAAGAYAALAVPELPPEVAKRAIGVLAQGLLRTRRAPSAKKLASIVGKMRAGVVSSSVEPAEASQHEIRAAAMDLCLVVSERQPANSPYLKPPKSTRRITASRHAMPSLPLRSN